MKANLYCVRDRVAEVCSPVFQAVNHGVASRQVVRMLEDVPAYDRDAFLLWHVGEIDDGTGVIVALEAPVVIDVHIPRFEDIKGREFDFSSEVK